MMPDDPALPFDWTDEGDDVPDHELTCAFGYPWRKHFTAGFRCPGCEAETARLRDEFDTGVQAGQWDEQGNKPRRKR